MAYWNRVKAVARSSGEAAQTWQRSWVTIRSGCRLQQIGINGIDAFAPAYQFPHLAIDFGW